MRKEYRENLIQLLLIFTALLLMAFVSGSRYLWLLALFLMTVFLVSAAIGFLSRKCVTAEVHTQNAAVKGIEESCTLLLNNRGILPLNCVMTYVSCENRYTGETENFILTAAVGAKGTAEIPFAIFSSRCGYYVMRVEKITVRGILGIAGFSRKGDSSEGIMVLPEMFDTDSEYRSVFTPDCESFEYADDRKGTDMSEIFGIREYMPGDDTRSIHWKLSAKTDKVIVKEPGLPVTRSVYVFLDKSAERPAVPENSDTILEVFASVCRDLTEKGFVYRAGFDETGGIFEAEIRDMDSLMQLLERILTIPPSPDQSGLSRLLEKRRHETFGKIIYVTAAVSEETEDLRPIGNTTILCCGEEQKDFPDAVFFTSEDYKEKMKMPLL